MTLGIIGLGAMGKHIARHLAVNQTVIVYDQSLERMKEVEADSNLKAAESIGFLADSCSTILLVLPDTTAVDSVLNEMKGYLKAGTMIIDMGTTDIKKTIEWHKQWKEASVDFIDCPMTGGVYSAVEGNLTLYLGAPDHLVEKVKDHLQPVSLTIYHLGPAGSGQTMKAVNNLLASVTLVASCEAISFAVKMGLDLETVVDCINHGSGRNYATEVKFVQEILTNRFDSQVPLEMLYKDMNIALGMAVETQTSLPTSTMARELWKQAMNQLGKKADQTWIYLFLSKMNKN